MKHANNDHAEVHQAQLGMCPNDSGEAQRTFSRLATRLSVKSSVPRPEALSSILYAARLDMTLIRAMQCKGIAKQSYSRLMFVVK